MRIESQGIVFGGVVDVVGCVACVVFWFEREGELSVTSFTRVPATAQVRNHQDENFDTYARIF